MVHRLVVQYGTPTDPAHFDEHYKKHIQLCHDIPGLLRYTIGRPRSLDGSETPYLVAELDFESAEAFAAGMGSPAGQAAGKDVPTFASGGATMQTFDVDDVSPGTA